MKRNNGKLLSYGLLLLPLFIWLVINPPVKAIEKGDLVGWMTLWMLGAIVIGAVAAFITMRRHQMTYRIASASALAGAILITLSNGAVGIIGSEDNQINLIYAVVLISGYIAAAVRRFEAKKMSAVMYAIASALALLAVLALSGVLAENEGMTPQQHITYLMIHATFVLLFALPGYLYNRTATRMQEITQE